MKILLLSPYHAHSHKRWCEGLIRYFSEHKWHLLTLPPRFFNWRIRGNSLTWATEEREALNQNYDLVVATSMTDLNGLYGFIPNLQSIPSILYFHENQFAYPLTTEARENIEPKLVPVYAALCADKLCFNSQYNYQTFFQGLRDLMARLPDGVPQDLCRQLEKKSIVLPVPLVSPDADKSGYKRTKFTIVWNHRWEYDKWPESFFKALLLLKNRRLDFQVHVIGQQFRKMPDIFESAKQDLAEYIVSWGRVEDEGDYQKILRESHVVVSTALHDFQGLSVLEAVMNGAIPVVPARLSYVELFDEEYCYKSYSEDLSEQSIVLADRLNELIELYNDDCLPSVPDLSPLSWESLKESYRSAMESVTS